MRPARVEIDLDAIRRNVSALGARLAGGCGMIAVVKANAYGHGDVEVSRSALSAGAQRLGVILVEEAQRLRDAGIEAPILLLHEPSPDDAGLAVGLGLTPSVFTERVVEALGTAAEQAGRSVPVHLKVDTGLNRLGVPCARIDEVVTALAKWPRLEIEGVFSHFAFADEPGHPFVDLQIERFHDALDRLRRHGIEPPLRHLANSAATLTRPEAHFDLVRPGIALYGLAPGPRLRDAMPYAPAMRIVSEVAMAKRVPAGQGVSYGLRYTLPRDGFIATVPLGYADGWPRASAGVTHALIGGRRHTCVGTVTMDSFMVDCGDYPVEIGEEVVLLGEQGDERVSAEEIADATHTINYEVVTGVSARMPRVFSGVGA